MYQVYNITSDIDLESLSSMLNISLDELKRINKFIPNELFSGDSIVIPFDDGIYMNYVVKKGDNLYNIASSYNTSVSEIMNFNNLSTNLLSIGQILRIPVSEKEVFVYIVKSGDNLYSIAREYNTTVDSIKAKNNLTSNLLSIGQTLVI